MRSPIPRLVLLAAICVAPCARAFRAESDLTVSREFVYFATDLQGDVLDGLLSLGGGFTVVSGAGLARCGLRLLAELNGDRVSGGLFVGYAPPQDGRGWLIGEPHATVRIGGERVLLELEARLGLRRIGVVTLRGLDNLDQLQLRGEATLTLDERWRVGLLAIRSFYEPDPAGQSLRGADLGPAVSLAGRPEEWALGGRAGRRFGERWLVEAGLTGSVYADGRGGALMPRVVARAGPWGGFAVEASLELVIAVGAADDPIREIGGLNLEFEH